MKIKIKEGLEIGDNCPPFIIAEVGSNWRNLDDCLISIEKAKECGADAVKFQAYTKEALYGVEGLWIADRKDTNDWQLPLSWLPILKQKADSCGIEFMCSAFSPELIDAVDPFVNIHKLASAEMCHVRMLEKLRQMGKPLFMSTGGHGVEEIRKSIEYLTEHIGWVEKENEWPLQDTYRTIPLVLMYCVSAYPAQEIDLGQISYYRERFGTLVGYSDHSTDVRCIPKYATDKGASVIEKHVTFIDAETPDSPHSLSADQFRAMVGIIRSTLSLLPGPTPEEKAMILRHNRRLIATKEIKKGEELHEGHNCGIYRSLQDSPKGLSPFKISEIEGKKAKKDIQIGDAISEGDL